MKNILKVFALLIAMGFSQIANAQLYNSEACYYAKEEGGPKTGIRIIRFDGEKVYYAFGNIESVRMVLSEDPTFFDNMDNLTQFPKGIGFYGVDGSKKILELRMDNYIESSKTMYSNAYKLGNHSSIYLAFPDDLSYYRYFVRNGEKLNYGTKYVRISKEYFSPQGINDDVLRLLEE